jgi:predicted RNA-binding Zn-ribbon protein involved in translation (DUF1610 family)
MSFVENILKKIFNFLSILNSLIFMVVYVSYFFALLSYFSEYTSYVLLITLGGIIGLLFFLIVATQGILLLLFINFETTKLIKTKIIFFSLQYITLLSLLFILLSSFVISFFQLEIHYEFLFNLMAEYNIVANNIIIAIWLILHSPILLVIIFWIAKIFKENFLLIEKLSNHKYKEWLANGVFITTLGVQFIGVSFIMNEYNENIPPEWFIAFLKFLVLDWPIFSIAYILYVKYFDWQKIHALSLWEVLYISKNIDKKCPKCGKMGLQPWGKVRKRDRYRCKVCKYTFIEKKK